MTVFKAAPMVQFHTEPGPSNAAVSTSAAQIARDHRREHPPSSVNALSRSTIRNALRFTYPTGSSICHGSNQDNMEPQRKRRTTSGTGLSPQAKKTKYISDEIITESMDAAVDMEYSELELAIMRTSEDDEVEDSEKEGQDIEMDASRSRTAQSNSGDDRSTSDSRSDIDHSRRNEEEEQEDGYDPVDI